MRKLQVWWYYHFGTAIDRVCALAHMLGWPIEFEAEKPGGEMKYILLVNPKYEDDLKKNPPGLFGGSRSSMIASTGKKI